MSRPLPGGRGEKGLPDPLPKGREGLTTGTFRPTNYPSADDDFPAPVPSGLAELSGFDGMNPNGSWKLWVQNDAFGNGGFFEDGWSITIKAKVRR